MQEGDIKKGWNIYLYYWTIFAFIFFFLINYYSKNIKINFENIGLMISVLSFLFGFLVNINFSMIMSRMNYLKNDLASETGRLVSLYSLSKHLGEKFHENIKELIDEYTIHTLRNYNNYEVGRGIFYRIHKEFESIEVKNDFQKMMAGSFLSNLNDWEQVRERLEYLTGKGTEWSLKFSAYLLGIILIILLFLNRGDMFTDSLFIILSTVIVFIFLIIEDYDDLRIGDYQINISNSEQLFDLIGKERYYPQSILNKVQLEKGKVYRIGVYNTEGKEERIFKIAYTPHLHLKIARIERNLQREK
ncbi:Uncharacterised protein [uncultured archaeon]|nr:Uncharacterised protein [uncultured archaeon]